MPRSARAPLVAVLLLVLAASPSSAQEASRDRGAEQVRAARARSNAAFAARDTGAMRREWMADISVVSSTGERLLGATAYAAAMADTYRRRPDAVYVRTPTAVRQLSTWAVASEQGTWVGRWKDADGPVEIGGTYLAQWRLVDGAWRIQAELFVPTRCRGGAYCAGRPR